MKFGINGKLFLAIFATCMLIIFIMHLGVRFSFERGFIGYIRDGNEQRITQLANALEDQYRQNGSWHFLRSNEKLVFRLMRSLEHENHKNNAKLPQNWRTQIWILDEHRHKLVGPSAPPPPKGPSYTMKVDDKVIGWVVSTPTERLTRHADIHFYRQQLNTIWFLMAFATLMALLVTWLLSRNMVAPVKRLIGAIHELASGNFSSRVPVSSRDELGQLARDFNQLSKTLEKNERLRREFMADVSHELRTPLAILRGELEALEDGIRKLTPDSLTSLQAEVATLTKLVDDLHQLSLSDVGALTYRKIPIDLNTLIQIAAGTFKDRLQSKPLNLELLLPPTLPFFGDPDRLTQLFNNLFENTLRYTDPHGKVVISADVTSQHITLFWQDSAPGVSEEQAAQLFERFYRTESSRNRASGGSGLGLAICHNIVEAHHGNITASPSALGGLQITIRFEAGLASVHATTGQEHRDTIR